MWEQKGAGVPAGLKSGSSSKKARGGFDSHMLPPKMILLTLTSMANSLLCFVGAGQSFRVSQEILSVKFLTDSLKVLS